MKTAGKSYTWYFTVSILFFMLLLLTVLLFWIYFSTSAAIKQEQSVSMALNSRNIARILDDERNHIGATVLMLSERLTEAGPDNRDELQDVLDNYAHNNSESVRLDLLRFISAGQEFSVVADSPFFDFIGAEAVLSPGYHSYPGRNVVIGLRDGNRDRYLLVHAERVVDAVSGRVAGVLFGGYTLDNNMPLLREILTHSNAGFAALMVGDAIIGVSSPLPEVLRAELGRTTLQRGQISIRGAGTDGWVLNVSPYLEVDGLPLSTVLVFENTLHAKLLKNVIISGGFVAIATVLLCLLFVTFFGNLTSSSIDNLLTFTQQAVLSDGVATYRMGFFREFNEIGQAVEKMVDSLDSAADKLTTAKEEAEAASRAKSVFLASMTHELRTPLNAILGYAQMFEGDTSLTEKQKANIRTMRQSGEHLLLLINDILDMSKIESGKIELVEQEFRFPEFMDNVVDIIRVRTRNKDVAFHYHHDKTLPQAVIGDELRLRQVLLNLLSNAVKFTDQGFCSLSVMVNPSEDGLMGLTVKVLDTGPGIPLDMQDKIFEPFQQSGERLKYSEGTGLGLPISRKLVNRMGGDITVISPVPAENGSGVARGSCFSFTIPIKTSVGSTIDDKLPDRVFCGYRSKNPEDTAIRRILIVDDEPVNRMVLKDTLIGMGFDTEESSDGTEILAVCERFRPHAVIMDLRMPGVDGFAATRLLKGNQEFSGVPIIALTAFVGDEGGLRERCATEGFSDFLGKPYSRDALLGILAKRLDLVLVREKNEVGSGGSDGDIVPPPENYLKEVTRLASLGDISEMERIAAEIKVLDSGKYRLFADKLAMLVDRVELGRIEKMLAGFLAS